MKKIFPLLLFPLFLLIFDTIHAQIPSSPWVQQMSAEQTINLPGGKSISSHIYVDNEKVRVDTNAAGMDISTITRIDKKLIYMIMPAQKMVTQMPLSPRDQDGMKAFDPKNLKFELVGQGVIDGIECDKYKLIYTSNKGQIFWINKTTRLPVLMEAEDGSMKIHWRNVVAGPQPAALFEPPAGYKVTNMPLR